MILMLQKSFYGNSQSFSNQTQLKIGACDCQPERENLTLSNSATTVCCPYPQAIWRGLLSPPAFLIFASGSTCLVCNASLIALALPFWAAERMCPETWYEKGNKIECCCFCVLLNSHSDSNLMHMFTGEGI